MQDSSVVWLLNSSMQGKWVVDEHYHVVFHAWGCRCFSALSHSDSTASLDVRRALCVCFSLLLTVFCINSSFTINPNFIRTCTSWTNDTCQLKWIYKRNTADLSAGWVDKMLNRHFVSVTGLVYNCPVSKTPRLHCCRSDSSQQEQHTFIMLLHYPCYPQSPSSLSLFPCMWSRLPFGSPFLFPSHPELSFGSNWSLFE